MANQVKVHGLLETVARLKNLPTALSGKNGGPVRKALFQAAKIIEVDAKLRAPVDPKTETDIPSAIRKVRDRNPRAYPGRPTEVYHIGVYASKKHKARHWHFLEFGTVKQAAQPYLRPAFENKKEEAVKVFAAILKKDVDRLERTVK